MRRKQILQREKRGALLIVSHLNSFCRWLVKDRCMGENSIAHLEAGNVGLDRRHDRRELDAIP